MRSIKRPKPALCQASDPPCPTVERCVSYAPDGSEVVSFKSVDLASVQKSNSPAEMWDVSRLVKSGVDPSRLSGRSSSASRLDGFSYIQDISSQVDTFLSEQESHDDDSNS